MSELIKYFNGDEMAANVWLSKYALEGEETPDDMHKRMAKEFARIEKKYIKEEHKLEVPKLQDTLSNYGFNRVDLNEDAIYDFFDGFKYIIPQGSIMSTLGTDIIASLSNCWVVESPYDSYGGILKADGHLAYYYKRRGGAGLDISNLRPKGTNTKNTAKSSTGAVSFMHRFSNTTREVAMEGRRGANMQSISINHPDVMDFIKVKRDGTSVTGANISIRLTDEFMKAVEKDEDYLLKFPCDTVENLTIKYKESLEYNKLYSLENNTSFKKIKAKEYWDEIIHSAKNHAEPGLMYWDNVLDYDPAAVYEQFKPVSSNPCGEQFLNANDSCRLMVLNLFSFVNNPFTDKAEIDYKKLYEIAYEHARLGDDLVDLELEYIERIINKIKSDPEPDDVKRDELDLWYKSYTNTKNGRRIGLGITALGDMLAALGLKYDSDEGLDIIDKVMKIKMKAELDCTIDLSILRGSFEGYDINKEFTNIHSGYEDDGIPPYDKGNNSFYQFILENFPSQFERMLKYKRRSVSWSTIAPTGSVSILTQTTSGCEPLFQPFYIRRKKINPNDKNTRVDFIDEIGDTWQEFPVLHPKFKDWLNIDIRYSHSVFENWKTEDYQKAFEESPWYQSTANDIDWIKRVEVQSILQKYTTNAISSTINLPSTVTEQEVSDIYMNGWKKKLKGQTVYVEGSRSGVLVSESDKDKVEFVQNNAVKRPKTLDADIYTTVSKGNKLNVIVGLLDDKPYEVFVVPYFTNRDKLQLTKAKKGTYNLLLGDKIYSEDIAKPMTDVEEALTRLISMSLRHGADIQYVVEQLGKTNGDITSFTKAIGRTFKKYISDEKVLERAKCEDCGSTNIRMEEGCTRCNECGSSKCG